MKKKILKIVLIIVIILLVLFFSFNLISNYFLNKANIDETINQDVIEDSIVIDETKNAHDVVNFVLVGADNYDKNYNSYNERSSDAIKIVSLDYSDKIVKITSLNEDIIVYEPNENVVEPLWKTFKQKDATSIINTINSNLDMDISKYVYFSFAGFIDVIDEIGGIDIELTKEEAKAMNNPAYGNKVSIYAKEGINHMHGNDALTYARINYLDSGFVRMERQNKVIQAIINKLKDAKADDLLSCLNVCLPHISTNLSTSEIKSYVLDLLDFDLDNIQKHSYPTHDEKDADLNKEGIYGYVLKSYSNQVIDLHKFIYGTNAYEPTQNIKTIEDKINSEVLK